MIGDVQTTVKLNLENAEKIEEEYDIEDWKYKERWGGKIYSYRVAFFEIPKEINFLTGYGPSSYTSRASEFIGKKLSYYLGDSIAPRLNLSDEQIGKINTIIGEGRGRIFQKYAHKIRFRSTLNAPMTSVISIWVEIGMIGMFFFILFFIYLFIRLRNNRRVLRENENHDYYILNKSSVILLVYLIINLFYLNYWEYPEFIIPVMTFVLLSLNQKKIAKK
jgi:hypothetical protein